MLASTISAFRERTPGLGELQTAVKSRFVSPNALERFHENGNL